MSALGEVLSPSAHAIDALVFVLTVADFIQGRPDPVLLLIWTQPGRRAGSGLLTVLPKPERLLTRAEDLGRQPRYIPPGNRAVLRAEWPKPVRHRGTWRRPRHHHQGRRLGGRCCSAGFVALESAVAWRKPDSQCSPLGSTRDVAVRRVRDSPERCCSSWTAESARAELMPRREAMLWPWRQGQHRVALQSSGGDDGTQTWS